MSLFNDSNFRRGWDTMIHNKHSIIIDSTGFYASIVSNSSIRNERVLTKDEAYVFPEAYMRISMYNEDQQFLQYVQHIEEIFVPTNQAD
jgi:hypothetical protein